MMVINGDNFKLINFILHLIGFTKKVKLLVDLNDVINHVRDSHQSTQLSKLKVKTY